MTICCQCDGVTPPPEVTGACCYDDGGVSLACVDSVSAGDCLSRSNSTFFPNKTCSQVSCVDGIDSICCLYKNPTTGVETKLGCIPDDGDPDQRIADCIAAGHSTTNLVRVFTNEATCDSSCLTTTSTTPAPPTGRCCECFKGFEEGSETYTCTNGMTEQACLAIDRGSQSCTHLWKEGATCASDPCPTPPSVTEG